MPLPEERAIRRLQPADRPALLAMLQKVNNFDPQEVDVAMELIDIALSNPMQTDYNIFVLVQNNEVTGYHCTGRRPLTDGTYDLYWIVVDPDRAGKGSGSLLLRHAESFVQEQNGRWVLAETSSRSLYQKTRDFYVHNNYALIAEIPDFYSVGDSLCIYGKRITI